MRAECENLLLCSAVPRSSGSKLDLNSYAGTGKPSSAQPSQYSPRILAAKSSLAEHSAAESITNISEWMQSTLQASPRGDEIWVKILGRGEV